MRRPEDETGLRKWQNFFRFIPCRNRKAAYTLSLVRKQRRARGGAPGDKANGREKIGFEQLLPHVFSAKWGMLARGERWVPLAGPAKPLKRLKTAMGSYWKKLAWIWVWRHVGLGLAPRPFGAGAASAWDRRGL
jgi:hypothetical protein